MADLARLRAGGLLITGLAIGITALGRAESAPGPQGSGSIPRYRITDLGTLGGSEEIPTAINNLREIVGRARTADGKFRAFKWQLGQISPLHPNAAETSMAFALNDAGQVVGATTAANGVMRAVLWQNGGVEDLGHLGQPFSIAYGINNTGEVVGLSKNPDGDERAFLWQNGSLTDLGTLGPDPANSNSEAYGINDSGQIVGTSEAPEGAPAAAAFLFQNNVMSGLPGARQRHSAVAINLSGQIVGSSISANGDTVATLWQNGQRTELPTLNRRSSHALDINDAGDVVGSLAMGSPTARAVLWTGGQVVDLNERVADGGGWTLQTAASINNDGYIVGQGRFQGRGRAFLLTPITELETGPDLTATWQSLRLIARKRTLKGQLIVRNSGTTTASATRLRIFLSTDGTVEEGDTLLKTIKIPSLRAGKTQKVSVNAKIGRRVSVDSRYVIAVADALQSVEETEEVNNTVAFGPL